MPTETEHDWGVIAERLGNLPGAVDGYIETLRAGIAERRRAGEAPGRARSPCRRASHARPDGFFGEFAAGRQARRRASCPNRSRAELAKGAEVSAAAYARARRVPRDGARCRPPSDQDAVGRELYALHSRHFLGAVIDLDETYEWGIEELAADDRRADADRGGDQGRRERRRGGRVPRRRSVPPSQRHRRAAALDAVAQRHASSTSSSRTHFDIPEPDPQARVHDRPDPGGRHLLHEPERRLLAPRTDVVERPRGRHRVQHLARDDDGVPRGRARSPPPARPGRLQPRASSTPGAASWPARAGTPRAGRSTPSA